MLKQQLQADVKEAMKQRNQEKIVVLRMALASIASKGKEKRYKISKDLPAQAGGPALSEEELVKKSELEDDEIITVITSEIKKRKDAIALYEQGNRPELAAKEKEEITMLQAYLPEQLPQAELEKLIKESIEKTGAKEMKDMGRVMADLAPKVKGKADNSEISRIIKEALQK
ncbi:MAG: GatB/YqeY domain-containing protein [bacterium]|nr:GatB/YqeY domain-containing protein [bacterium]